MAVQELVIQFIAAIRILQYVLMSYNTAGRQCTKLFVINLYTEYMLPIQMTAMCSMCSLKFFLHILVSLKIFCLIRFSHFSFAIFFFFFIFLVVVKPFKMTVYKFFLSLSSVLLFVLSILCRVSFLQFAFL